MKKPERLWVLYNDSSHLQWECRESPLSDLDQEYVRADVAAARIAEVAADRDNLRKGIRSICDDVWGYDDPDGGDTQDVLEKLGILVEVPASADVRDEYGCDVMYQVAWEAAAIKTSYKLQRCDYCGEHVERGDLWLISGANGYCSATCARDHAQHERDHADDLDREDAREQG